jgi:TolB protein
MAACTLAVCALTFAAASANASYPGVNGKIAFTRCEDGVNCTTWKLWTMNADGSGAARLLADPGHGADVPSFSADGRRIVVQRCTPPAGPGYAPNCGIATVDAHGNGLKQLTPFKYGGDNNPTFSPDGSRIAFDRYVASGYEIWIMNADGSDSHRLTNSGALDQHPQFTHDGKRIIYTHALSGVTSDSDLWSMKVDGSDKQPLTTDPNRYDDQADISPDGHQIVFQGGPKGGGPYSIWIASADGSGAHALTSTPTRDDEPAFSPEGKRVIFTRTLADGTSRLYSIAATGGSLSQIGNGDDWYASWGRIPTPSIDSPPKIAGVAQAGHQLSATAGPGGWGGSASLQWLRCAAGCAPIAGATAATYKPTNADIGARLQVRQTQTSAGGSVNAVSAATAPVAAEPGAAIVGKLGRKGKARLLARLSCPAAESVVCNGRLALTARVRGRSVKVAAGNFQLAAGTKGKLTLRVSKKARKALAKARTLNAALVTRDDAGNTTKATAKVTVKHA